MPDADRPVRAAAPRHGPASRCGPPQARVATVRAHAAPRWNLGTARALRPLPVRDGARLCGCPAARRWQERSAHRACRMVPALGERTRHTELGQVLAGPFEPLRLAGAEPCPAGAVASPPPRPAAPIKLVLPHTPHLHGDGVRVRASVPGARDADHRGAAGGALSRRFRQHRLRHWPQPLERGRPLCEAHHRAAHRLRPRPGLRAAPLPLAAQAVR